MSVFFRLAIKVSPRVYCSSEIVLSLILCVQNLYFNCCHISEASRYSPNPFELKHKFSVFPKSYTINKILFKCSSESSLLNLVSFNLKLTLKIDNETTHVMLTRLNKKTMLFNSMVIFVAVFKVNLWLSVVIISIACMCDDLFLISNKVTRGEWVVQNNYWVFCLFLRFDRNKRKFHRTVITTLSDDTIYRLGL